MSTAVIDARAAEPARTGSTALELWLLDLEVTAHAQRSLRSTLSQDELERAARFRFRRDAERFVAGRGQLRRILAGLLECDPAALRFAYGPSGKPSLRGGADLSFNLAHTQALGLLAVTADAKVGVDIESHSAPVQDCEELAHGFFAPAEVRTLMALPRSQRDVAFLRCWTRKEAYVKALGDGLQLPLEDFAVSLAPGTPARLRWCRRAGELERWTLMDLSELCGERAAKIGSGSAVAAACVEGGVSQVNLHQETPW
jgi:4'-phosphopantetheinyl transferase